MYSLITGCLGIVARRSWLHWRRFEPTAKLVRYQDFSVIQAETICANLLECAWCAAITPPAKRMSSPDPIHLPSTIVLEDQGALVSLAKSGDLTACDELVNRYERRIFPLPI